MSGKTKHYIVKYKVYVIVLLVLLGLTGLSVAITSIELGAFAVAAALIFASAKSTLVLIYFMHLKFDNIMYTIMISLVTFVFVVLIIITFLDYYFR